MKTIHKYTLDILGIQRLFLPAGAEILAVQAQNNIPCLWAMVQTENRVEERVFEMFGTGQPIGEDMGVTRKYISTFQLANGAVVFHLFERLT